ncbi:hypothetical protein [Sphingomonas sp.]|uniref:hypothetical protein n=1 Tax=Sphingomonas sp. TaxID=28214 RepID=UPI0035AF6F08
MLERYRVAALATEQSAADARPASQLVTALAEAWVETEGLRRQIVDVERAIAEREQLQASMVTLRAREQEQRQQLVEAGGSADGVYEQSETLLLEQELVETDAKLAASDTPKQIDVRLKEAEAVLTAELTKRGMLQQSRDAAGEDVEAARTMLRQHAEIWTDEKGLLVDLENEQAAIESGLSTSPHGYPSNEPLPMRLVWLGTPIVRRRCGKPKRRPRPTIVSIARPPLDLRSSSAGWMLARARSPTRCG